MAEWFSKLHEFFTEGAPFVVATVTSLNGSSPDRNGACVICSEQQTACFLNSESRRTHMLTQCQSILRSKQSFQVEEQKLGTIAGSANGHCVITYEFFAATHYPRWLKRLRSNLQNGINSIWLREFNNAEVVDQVINTNAASNEGSYAHEHQDAVAAFAQKGPEDNCLLISKGDTSTLLRSVHNTNLSLILVGDHPVAAAIKNQITSLPISLTEVASTDQNIAKHIIEPSYVIIMTRDHELDYEFCRNALDQKAIKFLGCIGSEKKAQLFKTKLQQQGAAQAQINKLIMPIGWTQISGKQSAVVAASIIAQLMSLHTW